MQTSSSSSHGSTPAEVQAGELFNKIVQKAMELEEVRFGQHQIDVTTRSLPLDVNNKKPRKESKDNSIPSPTLGPVLKSEQSSLMMKEDANISQEVVRGFDFKIIGSESEFEPPSPTEVNAFRKLPKLGAVVNFVRELKDAREARIVSAEKHMHRVPNPDLTIDGYSKYHSIPAKCREEVVREVAHLAADLVKEVSLIIASHVVNTNLAASVRLKEEHSRFGGKMSPRQRDKLKENPGIVKNLQSLKVVGLSDLVY